MTTKHTPGPWIVASDKTTILELDSPTDKPCRAVVDCASGDHAMPFETAQSNARLIAAAPELLTWLRWALDRVKDDVIDSYQYERARELIDRIDGDSPSANSPSTN